LTAAFEALSTLKNTQQTVVLHSKKLWKCLQPGVPHRLLLGHGRDEDGRKLRGAWAGSGCSSLPRSSMRSTAEIAPIPLL